MLATELLIDPGAPAEAAFAVPKGWVCLHGQFLPSQRLLSHVAPALFRDGFLGLLHTEFPSCPGDGSPAFGQRAHAVPRWHRRFPEARFEA